MMHRFSRGLNVCAPHLRNRFVTSSCILQSSRRSMANGASSASAVAASGEGGGALSTSTSGSSLDAPKGGALLVGEWEMALEEKFGTGTHRLRRALFREFCDEMRGEVFTKPPPPFGEWEVQHTKGTDVVTFSNKRENTIDGVECLVVGRLKFEDPPGKASHVGFVDNHYLDVYIERSNVVIHFHMGVVERGIEVKNIRVFNKDIIDDITDGEPTLAVTVAKMHERHELIYDGPSIHHLEDDLFNETHDVLTSADIDIVFAEWAVKWISYLEHVEYLRWNLSVQDSILAMDGISVQELVTEVEMDVVKEPMDTWQRAK